MSALKNSMLSCHPEPSSRKDFLTRFCCGLSGRAVEGSVALAPFRLLPALFCLVVLLTAISPAQIKPWNQIQAPPLPAFKPQEPVRIQLGNGMVIFLQD